MHENAPGTNIYPGWKTTDWQKSQEMENRHPDDHQRHGKVVGHKHCKKEDDNEKG